MSEIKSYEQLSHALGLALIEIRAAETLEVAQGMADVFHNVPAKMSCHLALAEIERELRIKAQRVGLEQEVLTILRHSQTAISR